MAGAFLLRLLLIVAALTAPALAARDGDNGAAATSPPAIVQIVADDLGYNDLGFTNGGKTRERRAWFSIWSTANQLSSVSTCWTAAMLPDVCRGWQTRRTSTWR